MVLLTMLSMVKMHRYKVVVSNRTRQTLADHVRFQGQKSLPAARETKNELRNALHSLSTMPEQFQFLDVYFIVDCRQDWVAGTLDFHIIQGVLTNCATSFL